MNSKVSIIVSAYNVEHWVGRCIRSVLNQTYRNFELIIVNDGSTDNTQIILESFRERAKERLVILEQSNAGLSAARNRALLIATGEYVTFLDADDYILDTYIEKLVLKAEDANLDCVVCGYTRISENGTIIKKNCPNIRNEYYKIRFLAGCFKLYKMDYMNKLRIKFPEGKIFEDIPVTWRLLFSTDKVDVIGDDEYMYTERANSISRSSIDAKRLSFDEYKEVISELVNKSGQRELFEYSVLSFCTYFLFVQCRKSTKEVIGKTIQFCYEIFNDYIVDYSRNRYIKGTIKNKQLPFTQRWGIVIFVFLLRRKWLNIAYLFCV